MYLKQKHTTFIFKIMIMIALAYILSCALDASNILNPPSKCNYLTQNDHGINFDFQCYKKRMTYMSLIFLAPAALIFIRPKKWFSDVINELVDEQYNKFIELYSDHNIENIFSVKRDEIYSYDEFEKVYRGHLKSGKKDNYEFYVDENNNLKVTNTTKNYDAVNISQNDLELRFRIFNYLKKVNNKGNGNSLILQMYYFYRETLKTDAIARFTLKDYILNNDYLDEDNLLESWRWLINSTPSLLMITYFGDAFFEETSGEIYLLNSSKGEYEKIADDYDEFLNKAEEYYFIEKIFLIDLILELKIKKILISTRQVYSFKKPPLLGGKYEVENIELLNIEDHFRVYGQLNSHIHKNVT